MVTESVSAAGGAWESRGEARGDAERRHRLCVQSLVQTPLRFLISDGVSRSEVPRVRVLIRSLFRILRRRVRVCAPVDTQADETNAPSLPLLG